MGIPDHLTCLLRTLYAGQEATVRAGHGTVDWFKVGKGVLQDCILSPCLFNLYAECIMWNAGRDEAQAGIKIAGRNTNKVRYAVDTTLMTESEEELKSLLMRVKEEERKTGLKLNMQKIKLMASTPIISWQKDGGKVETVKYFFYFLGLQNHCGWWLKLWNLKMLSPWKKSYDKLRQCIKKQRHHFANKNLYHQSYGSSSGHVWMWELDHKEGWVPKNWCFQIVVLDKILESPLDCKETKPVNPKGNQLWIFTGS